LKTDTLVTIGDLMAGTAYDIHVFELSASGNGDTAATEGMTAAPNLEVHFPLDTLDGDTAIVDIISGEVTKFVGLVEMWGEDSSGIGIPTLKFVQKDIPPITTYIPITDIVAATEMVNSLLERTISFWLKNDEPDRWAIPLSIAKRTGMTIAFKNDSIWAFTKHRVNAGTGNNWHAQGFGVPYTSGTGWAYITYVYHEPYTYLYINGELAGSLMAEEAVAPYPEGASGWPWPGPWGFGGDKSYEIGALYQPCAANVAYLNGTWDAAVMQPFFGSMADLKFHNFALSADSIKSLFDEMAVDLNLRITAKAPTRLALVWDSVPGVTSYEIMQDGAAVDTVKTQAKHYIAEGLTAEAEYTFQVNPLGGLVAVNNSATATTLAEEMMVQLPLDAIDNDSIVNSVNGTKDHKELGNITVVDAESSGLGIPALKFNSVELPPTLSYIKLYNTVTNFTNNAFLGRTINFWLKMENDDTAVPFSFGKRRGGGILIENGMMHAMTGARHDGSSQWADSTGAAYTPGGWTMVTYQYDYPNTKLYINGELADESDGLGYSDKYKDRNYPTPLEDFWEANEYGSGTGASAQIGAQVDPFYPMVYYWQLPGWDPGYSSYQKWGLNGMMADMRMFNFALSADSIFALWNGMVVDMNARVQAYGPEDITLRWDDVEGETGYTVSYSADGEAWTEAGNADADAVAYVVTGLDENTTYYLMVEPDGISQAPMNNVVMDSTLVSAMVSHLEFAELVGDTALECSVTGALDNGIVGFVDIAEVSDTLMWGDKCYEFSGLNSIHFTQQELPPVTSYVRLYNTILPAMGAFNHRSFTFWMQNEEPDGWSVPFSVCKRTGFAIVIKNGMIHAFTNFRPRFPAGIDWLVDSTGAEFTSSEWAHVAYVFDYPVTKLYVNGELVDESDGKFRRDPADFTLYDLLFVTNVTLEAGGDKSGEIGIQLDPDAATVTYLGDTWDPGPHHPFFGSMADLRMFNYSLTDLEIEGIRDEFLNEVTCPIDAIDDIRAEKIRVYPNPAANILYFSENINAEVSVFDNVGKMVLRSSMIDQNQMDISGLSEGLYFLRISSGEATSVIQISVVR
jgi:hypothetical protein